MSYQAIVRLLHLNRKALALSAQAHCHSSGLLARLPINTPRSQALLEDELCPIKWRDIFCLFRDAHNSSILTLFFDQTPLYEAEMPPDGVVNETAPQAVCKSPNSVGHFVPILRVALRVQLEFEVVYPPGHQKVVSRLMLI